MRFAITMNCLLWKDKANWIVFRQTIEVAPMPVLKMSADYISVVYILKMVARTILTQI